MTLQTTEQPPIAAGVFGVWLEEMRASLRGERGTDVPCGDCVGCCVSGYPVVIRAEDDRAMAEIPLRHIARAVDGRTLMLALPDGSCPMLRDRKCSIYASRPQTCRDYDCRVFAAAGIDAGGEERAVINRRVRAWRFEYANEADVRAHEAVRAAARFIRDKAASFPGRPPTAPTGIAVLAIKSYEVFLRADVCNASDEIVARAIVETSRAFDS
ncbi:MAG: YkgJ family cysteine cluster protein [Xanthomonadaceae bacterium]|nr:YkgJ family cysteine cluster protein [Xanthomonadaceae bacterium]